MATIYVDPTVGGTGTGSFADPFRSWSSVTWTAGNTYLQKAGTTFIGTLTVTTGGSSENARVVVGTYRASDGAQVTDGTSRAIVDGNGGGQAINVPGAQSFVTITSMEAKNARGANCRGIYHSASTGTNIIVEYCYAHDIRNASVSNGIDIRADNSIIRYNLVEDVGEDGIYAVAATSLVIVGNVVRGVSKDNSNGDCIQIIAPCDSLFVADNDLTHDELDAKQCIVVSGSATGGGSITRNICRGPVNGEVHHCINNSITNLIISSNYTSGGFRGIISDNTRIQGNIVAFSGTSAQVGIICNATNAVIANNTIIHTLGDVGAATEGIEQTAAVTGIQIANNVVVGFKYGIRSRPAAATESYNDVYNCTNPFVDNALGALGGGTGSVQVNPQLDSRYLPRNASLINAGTYLGGYDYNGKEWGSPPNIGAVENFAARSTATRTVGSFTPASSSRTVRTRTATI